MALIPKDYKRENILSENQKTGIESDNTVAKAMGDKIIAAESNPAKHNLEDGRSKEWEDRARINMDPQPDAATNVERDFEPEQIPKTGKKNDNTDNAVY